MCTCKFYDLTQSFMEAHSLDSAYQIFESIRVKFIMKLLSKVKKDHWIITHIKIVSNRLKQFYAFLQESPKVSQPDSTRVKWQKVSFQTEITRNLMV